MTTFLDVSSGVGVPHNALFLTIPSTAAPAVAWDQNSC